MSDSVLCQQVQASGFPFQRRLIFFACSFPFFPCFFTFFFFNTGMSWNFTHSALRRPLPESSMGRGVIRWRQYPVGIGISHRSCFSRVINTTPAQRKRIKKCLRRAGTWPLFPQCLCVTSASAQARITLPLSGVTKGYIPHLQHICRIEMPNAALFLFRSALHCTRRGKRKAICSLFFVLYVLDHCTKINCMHTSSRWLLWNAKNTHTHIHKKTKKKKKRCQALNFNLRSRSIHHKVFWYEATFNSIRGCSCTNYSSEHDSTVPVRRYR